MKIRDPRLYEKIKSFLSDHMLKLRKKSINTVDSYKYTINLFLEFIGEKYGKCLADIELNDFEQSNIMAFTEWLTEKRENKVSTVNLRLTHMRNFCRYLLQDDPQRIAQLSAIQDIAKQKDPDGNKLIYLSVEETKLVLSQPDIHDLHGIRDRFFMYLIYDSGCRVQEMLDLKTDSFEIGKTGAMLHVIGKGNKYRVVPVSDELIPMYTEYCQKYHGSNIDTDLLFYTKRKGLYSKMSSDNVRTFVEQYGAEARKKLPSIPRIKPHLFRHTRAMHLYMAGMPLELISQWLGHSQMETTLIYASATAEMKRKEVEKIYKKENSVFKEDEKFKYENDDEVIKRLYGLM
jgi:site-specific recombinase XerD